ncbi:MAG: hypothetical protein JW828_03125, partial [Sedimentisphaerales bacterium]|nr:hypothetical protein [Sedimentisphaerales bacterium]
MKYRPYIVLSLLLLGIFQAGCAFADTAATKDFSKEDIRSLPLLPDGQSWSVEKDWLLDASAYKAQVHRTSKENEIALSNGLITRTFRISPNGATTAFENHMTGESIIRGVKPEAMVTIDGVEYEVGGLKGQPNYAYLLPEWLDRIQADPKAFRLAGLETGKTEKRFEWKRKRYSADLPWPPPGVSLRMEYRLPSETPAEPVGRMAYMKDVLVSIHYELYDGVPLIAKWMTVRNYSDRSIRINEFSNEVLAVVEYESSVESPKGWEYPNIHVETEYAFLGMDSEGANKAVFWQPDPEYTTQVNYLLKTPCLLVTKPPIGPDVEVQPGKHFETFHTYLLIHDSSEQERKGLAVRRMMRAIAPWVTENPIMMHVRSAGPEAVRNGIDQCAETGFEMIILTFGSGFNIENDNPEYIAQIRELVDYAHNKGIEIGGYSLLASRRISDEHDVVNPETGRPGGFAAFGNSPCIGSEWGQEYFRKLYNFFEKTGFDLLEHDGSYPGDVCASTKHPGHEGLADSQWKQWKTIT